MTSDNQRESVAPTLGDKVLTEGLFFGFFTGISVGLLVLGYQAYSYLRTGEWLELSALDGLKYVVNKYIVSPETWPWLWYPRDWVGIHDLLQILPLSLFVVLVVTLISMIKAVISYAFEDPLGHLYNG